MEYNDDYINEISMKMILYAGDGRLKLSKALECVEKFEFSKAQEQIILAEDDIKQAHIHQTKILQSQAQGVSYEYSMLFAHAQDTVMTTNTEFNLVSSIVKISKSLFEYCNSRFETSNSHE